jgi:hypothetical protein
MAERSPDKRRPDKIFEELNKVKEKKADLTKEEIDYEKQKEECTFKPSKNSLIVGGLSQGSKGSPSPARSARVSKVEYPPQQASK